MPNKRTGPDYLDTVKKAAKKAVKGSLAYKATVQNPLTKTLVVAGKSVAKGLKSAATDSKKKKKASRKASTPATGRPKGRWVHADLSSAPLDKTVTPRFAVPKSKPIKKKKK